MKELSTVISHRLARAFSGSRGPWLAAALGVGLCLPALWGGLVGDDYLWWLILEGHAPVDGGSLPPLLHVYNFVPGGMELDALKEIGMLTWWADPDLSIALFRPLTVSTFLLDHAIDARLYSLQHLHSLLWYGIAIAMVGLIYRRVHGGASAVAGLAVLLFAVEDAHAMSAAWLANRHALVSLVLGAGAFLAHLEWRRAGRIGALAVALALLTSGLLAGETALSIVAYVVAWQLTLERGSLRRRFLPLLPYALLVVVWWLVYDHFGYGISGSGLYVDPGHDSVAFAGALLQRWPILQLGQWLQVPIDVVQFVPTLRRPAVLMAFVACAGLVWFFAPLLRRSAEARFWSLGMAFALVPLCVAFPMDRHLVFAGIGAFGLLSLQVKALGWLETGGTEKSGGARRDRLRKWVTVLLLLLHLPVASAMLVGRTAALPLFGEFFAGGANTAPNSPEVAAQSFFFVSGHEFPVAYISLIRPVEGQVTPGRVALLASFASDNRVTREDEDTLVIEPVHGFLAAEMDRLERRLDVPFQKGDRVRMPDFEAEVRQVTEHGRPQIVAFHFQKPLDDPTYRWFSWNIHGAVSFELPDVGEQVIVPSAPLESLFPTTRTLPPN
jgi:hypothetical protein